MVPSACPGSFLVAPPSACCRGWRPAADAARPAGWVLGMMVPFWFILKVLGILRVPAEEETLGLDESYHGGHAYPGHDVQGLDDHSMSGRGKGEDGDMKMGNGSPRGAITKKGAGGQGNSVRPAFFCVVLCSCWLWRVMRACGVKRAGVHWLQELAPVEPASKRARLHVLLQPVYASV